MSKKITIVKIIGKDEWSLTQEDVERWTNLCNKYSVDEVLSIGKASGEIKEVKELDLDPKNEHSLTLVKVGSHSYRPSASDLEWWRKLFEEAIELEKSLVFVPNDIDVEVINIDKIISVE